MPIPQNTWNDSTSNEESRYYISDQGISVTRICFIEESEERDRCKIELAYSHLYNNSTWLREMCHNSDMKIIVKNILLTDYGAGQPYIIFYFGHGMYKSSDYHAFFNFNTGLITHIHLVKVVEDMRNI